MGNESADSLGTRTVKSGGGRPLVLGLGLGAIGILAVVFRWDQSVLGWVTALRGAGWVGVLGFVGLYVAATVLSIPGSLLTLAAGWLYGPWLGTLVVSPSSMIGAAFAFGLGRTVARDWVKARVAKYRILSAIDAAVTRRPFFLVLLLRLSPAIPFNALNYGLGVTGVRWRHYLQASCLGMLPGTFLYVYIGSLAGNVAEISSGGATVPSAQRVVVLTVGLLATLLAVILVTRAARSELARALPLEA